ncbi:hypothetical protein [Streptomyces sp. NPDC048606]|uniref:hypothetical protein n=1 Tax=Streptomyces sp. NPDC048606 TaxID=3154726 RepID=UPI0034168D29
MKGKNTFRSPWNVFLCGIGLLTLFVGYATASRMPWSEAPFTITVCLFAGLWVSIRAALCVAWVDASGVRYLGILTWKRIPWAAIEEVTCEFRSGTFMSSAMPVLKLKSGESVSLDGLAGYTTGDNENMRVTIHVHEMNAAHSLYQKRNG